MSIASLNRALRALVPDIAAVTRGVGTSRHPGDWLYATAPTPVEGLHPILRAWLRSLAGPRHAEHAAALGELLSAKELRWEEIDPGALGWPTGAGVPPETPEATHALAGIPRAMYHLVPEVLVAELLRRSDRPEGFPRGFRRCPTADGRGVELMSWPPLDGSDHSETPWPYSYRVRLTTHTVPFHPEPVLHVTVGVRRWCPRRPGIPYQGSLHAYLLSRVPWITGLPESRSFRMAPVRWARVDGEWQLRWRGELKYLFDQITFAETPPDPVELGRDPLKYLGSGGPDFAAALVYATSGGGSHGIGAGASAFDRNLIAQWIGETLSDFLVPAAPLPKVSGNGTKAKTSEPALVRRRMAEVLGGMPLVVEVHHEDGSPARDGLRNAVLADLGLDPKNGITQQDGSTYWHTAELDLILRNRVIGSLGEALEVDSAIKDPQLRASRAAQPRIDRVVRELGPAAPPVLCLTELRSDKAFRKPGSDPKPALRVGFARTGRLTQFVTPDEERPTRRRRNRTEQATGPHPRLAAAWADLRRQLVGNLHPPRGMIRGLSLPDPVDTMAVYMLRRNATARNWAGRYQLPIAVWTSSDEATVWARTPGMDSWRSYHEVLLALAQEKAFRMPDYSDRQTRGFIRQVLGDVATDRPTVLLTWTQNLRLEWPELQNTQVVVDGIALDGEPLARISPQLRHVLVRTHDGDETPQCYNLTPQKVGLASGLFRLPSSERVFASVALRADSAKNSCRPMSSRARTWSWQGHEVPLDPRRDAANPQYVELTVALNGLGEDPLVWAALIHAQRMLADTYQGMLLLPLPLHLARKATEYAIPDTTVPETEPGEQAEETAAEGELDDTSGVSEE